MPFAFEKLFVYQMAVSFDIDAAQVLLMVRTLERARACVLTRAYTSNLECINEHLDATGADETLVNVLADAQCSGVLLITVGPDKDDWLIELLTEHCVPIAAPIGSVKKNARVAIVVHS